MRVGGGGVQWSKDGFDSLLCEGDKVIAVSMGLGNGCYGSVLRQF